MARALQMRILSLCCFVMLICPFNAAAASLSVADGSYVQVTDSPSLDITGAITLEAWVYKTWNGEDWNIIFSEP